MCSVFLPVKLHQWRFLIVLLSLRYYSVVVDDLSQIGRPAPWGIRTLLVDDTVWSASVLPKKKKVSLYQLIKKSAELLW